MIITMANSKGGAGKTTVMRALAGHAARLGIPVTILDCDTSENATRWMTYSREAGIWPDNIDVIAVNDADLLMEIAPQYAKREHHLTFIDLEGTTNEFFGAGLWLADLVICPVQLAGEEIFGAYTLHGPVMDQLKATREHLPPIIVVVTSIDLIDLKSRKVQDYWQLLADGGMKVAENKLVHRKAYKKLHLGGTLYTIPDPDLKAIADARNLFEEVLEPYLERQAEPA
uniref:ParA-like protein n=1 Tax=Ochrobactrum sp. LM19 TaxID=1449781 RepID=A0A0D5A0U7_9HYPH|nr:ParA family protein [Ochrobactrum sp. LM19]AJW30034.1 ParA-like protein [Ochrobactrum sp. LM19]